MITQTEIKMLIDVVKHARLERASFDLIEDGSRAVMARREKDPEGVTNFIRARVSLHHETWIVAPILEILEKYGVKV